MPALPTQGGIQGEHPECAGAGCRALGRAGFLQLSLRDHSQPLKLEKTSQVIKSNHQPDTDETEQPAPEGLGFHLLLKSLLQHPLNICKGQKAASHLEYKEADELIP